MPGMIQQVADLDHQPIPSFQLKPSVLIFSQRADAAGRNDHRARFLCACALA